MKQPSKNRMSSVCNLMILFSLLFANHALAQISFTSSNLSGESLVTPTSLQFGPDGRLYVSQQDGTIFAYTVVKNGANSYSVTNTETILLVKQIPNHNDNGALNNAINTRQVTGILVTGTAANPVIYVSSSDPRIGGNTSGTDTNLDTNSGIVSRLTKNGASWTKVDLVRGLPRSEENHSSNGMQLDAVNNILYLAQGGHTNTGAPSNNLALTPEYALSAAILSIDLDVIGNTTYDIPTLNNTAEPFGGSDGANQAMLVAGGPVQVYSPGYRNPYDLLITAAGKMYTWDNGPNAGWGAPPTDCTNAVQEPGAAQCDWLIHISVPGYYGGHANPTRGNYDNTFGGKHPVPESMENPDECTYLAPGTNTGEITGQCSSTNGIVEYKASNFSNAMKGNILAAAFNGILYRVELNAAGTALAGSGKTTLASGFGSTPLDVTAQGDADIFPGTIWICTYGSANITILEPADAATCNAITGSYSHDEDEDGYSDADEYDNGTDPCSPASVPDDFDDDEISDLNDTDDDNDGINDLTDLFALDPDNGTTTFVPARLDFDNTDDGGVEGWGFTGLMNNGTDYLGLYDPEEMTVGGAALKFTVDNVSGGDAYAGINSQQYAFQFGVNVSSLTTPFIAHTRIMAPFAGFTPVNYQSMGIFIGTGSQDNYLKLTTYAHGGAGGINVLLEQNGAPAETYHDAPILGASFVDLFLEIDPATNTVTPSYSVDNGTKTALTGAPGSIPSTWLDHVLAVGFISTSNGATPFPATWDYIAVDPTDDLDDDNDGIDDMADLFALDPDNGSTTTIPVSFDFDNSGDGGISDLGFTGLMNNGSNYADLFDLNGFTTGSSVLTVNNVPAGDAYGGINTQQYGFQFGVDVSTQTDPFIVRTRIMNPFDGFTPVNYQSMGLFIGAGDQTNYLKITIYAHGGAGGINVLSEQGDVPTESYHSAPVLGAGFVDLFLEIDPAANTVEASYSVDGGTKTVLTGTPGAIPSNWLENILAVGIISTSNGATPFPAMWDLIEVTTATPADCNGDPGGTAAIDDCGDCTGGNTGIPPNDAKDCNGDCDGTAFLNECNVCVGGNTGKPADFGKDCLGVCGGSATTDCNGVCNGGAITDCLGNCGGTATVDCNGVCGGTAFFNDCNICVGGTTGKPADFGKDCAGVCGGTAVVDCNGICGGSSIPDCNNVCGGTAFLNDCNVCVGGTTGLDPNTGKDCLGVCGGNAKVDCNGVCGGNATLDCNGVCDGGATTDCLGNCGGSATLDCNNVCNGTAFLNDCNICVGGTTGKPADFGKDCNGVCGGTATVDCNGICGGSATVDCNGVCGGTAVIDNCGVCGGNNSCNCNLQVTSFTLMKSGTGGEIGPLQDGAVVNLAVTGTINVRADLCQSPVGSVVFKVNGNNFITENVAPYALAGNSGSSYSVWNVSPGAYTIQAIPYSLSNGGGTQGAGKTISITVTNQNTDCNGVAGGTATIDQCGDCTGGNTGLVPNGAKDCNGVCDGTAFLNECGICVGGNTGKDEDFGKDCNGVCGGSAMFDCNGICGGSALPDCNNICGGGAFINECNICVGGSTGKPADFGKDCNGVCGGTAAVDCNGVCGGSATVDCNGICGGTAVMDNCGVCGGNNACNCSLQVTGFFLVQAGTANDIVPLDNGSVINKATAGSFNIRVQLCQSPVGSVKFVVNGSQTFTENVAPYALAGDNGGIYKTWNPNPGSYTIAATPYSSGNGGGTAGTGKTIIITIISQAGCNGVIDCNGVCNGTAFINECNICVGGNTGKPANFGKDCNGVCGGSATVDCNGVCGGNAVTDCNGVCGGTAVVDNCGVCGGNNSCSCNLHVTSFTLMKSGTGGEIGPLLNNAIINLAATGSINVRADLCQSPVGSVVFKLNGNTYKTENAAPYALAGDNNGSYKIWNVTPGSYTLQAIPYSQSGGTGTAGTSLTVSFSVISSSAKTSEPMAHTVGEENVFTDFMIYPNPNSGQFTVEMNCCGSGNLAVKIFNQLGQQVYRTDSKLIDDYFKQNINLSEHAPGIYLIQIESKTSLVSRKVVVN